jgi:hypothetical protein
MKKTVMSNPLMLLTAAIALAPPELVEFMNSPEEQARMDAEFAKMIKDANDTGNEEKTETED